MADHHHPEMFTPEEVRANFSPLVIPVAGGIGIGGIVLAFLLGLTQAPTLKYFFHSYLVSVCFFTSIGLGGLFFCLITHLVHAGWGVVVRRQAELLAAALPWMLVLFVPILISLWVGSDVLYAWNIFGDQLASDPLIAGKAAYLNNVSFSLRTVIYFALWGGLVWCYFRGSLKQDHTGDKAITLQMQKWAPPAVLLFSLTITFAAFDWMMSLAPHWFSTIFGVYYFAGSAVAMFASLFLFTYILQRTGQIGQQITVEHRHDMGKLLFGFMFFWGYIAFSQYILIWYGDVPEETGWYQIRQAQGWQYVSLLLLFGHFVIPMAGMMSRRIRRSQPLMIFWAIWLLCFHYVDIFYLVMPQMTDAEHHAVAPAFGLIDLLAFAGVGGVYVALVAWHAQGQALVPLKDPRLQESLAFHNV